MSLFYTYSGMLIKCVSGVIPRRHQLNVCIILQRSISLQFLRLQRLGGEPLSSTAVFTSLFWVWLYLRTRFGPLYLRMDKQQKALMGDNHQTCQEPKNMNGFIKDYYLYYSPRGYITFQGKKNTFLLLCSVVFSIYNL